MDFNTSRTRENLMRAFAGESQARNRYTFAAETAKNNKLEVIHNIFVFTANQELAHAKVFYDLLKENAGTTISVDGGYPVDIYDDVIKLLRAAEHNEMEEYTDAYASFSKIAEEEGFPGIANTFKMIANVENIHSERFKKFADLMEQDKLFISDIETEWMCDNNGKLQLRAKNRQAGLCPVE